MKALKGRGGGREGRRDRGKKGKGKNREEGEQKGNVT